MSAQFYTKWNHKKERNWTEIEEMIKIMFSRIVCTCYFELKFLILNILASACNSWKLGGSLLYWSRLMDTEICWWSICLWNSTVANLFRVFIYKIGMLFGFAPHHNDFDLFIVQYSQQWNHYFSISMLLNFN